MNWGTKLIIAMAAFMAFIITLSIRMIYSDRDDLVEKDYYERGLNYDQDYTRKQNTIHDRAEPEIRQEDGRMALNFIAAASGTVKFAHSKDRRLDKAFTINTGAGTTANVSLADIKPGYWVLTFEWQSLGKSYMFEKGVYIQ